MSMARKVRRGAKKPVELQGFDFTKLDVTDIENVTLDAEDHTVSVNLTIPVNQGENTADYQEMFDVEDNSRIGMAATSLAKAIVEEIRNRARKIRESESICATCTSKCCGREFGSVRVTQHDVERMKNGNVDVSEKTIQFYSHELFSGYVGEFRQVPYTGPEAEEDEKCCPHLRRTGCSIYQHRPKICREYSSFTCDIYQEDVEKVKGKIRLSVIT